MEKSTSQLTLTAKPEGLERSAAKRGTKKAAYNAARTKVPYFIARNRSVFAITWSVSLDTIKLVQLPKIIIVVASTANAMVPKTRLHAFASSGLLVAAVFAFFHSFNYLEAHPGFLRDDAEYVRHLWASIAVLLAGTVPFVLVARRSAPRFAPRMSRVDWYLLFVYLRLGLIVTLEFLHVRPFAEIHNHVTLNLENYYAIPQLYTPVMILWGYVNGYQIEAIYDAFGSNLSVANGQILGVVVRFNKLLQELLLLAVLEKLFEGELKRRELLEGTVEFECRRSKFLACACFLPFSWVVTYVWCAFDQFHALFLFLAVLNAKEEDYFSAGLSGACAFLTKVFGAFAIVALGVLLVKRRDGRNLVKLAAGFVVVVVGLGGVLVALLEPNLLTRNIVNYVFRELSRPSEARFPFFENVWMFGKDVPNLVAIVSVGTTVAFSASTAVRAQEFNLFAACAVLLNFYAFFAHVTPWFLFPLHLLFPTLFALEEAPVGAPKGNARKSFAFLLLNLLFFCWWWLYAMVVQGGDQRVVFSGEIFGTVAYYGWLITGYVSMLAGLFFAYRACVPLVPLGSSSRDGGYWAAQPSAWKEKVRR
ncbi:MAG: hypothetical protein Kow0069_29690 [Promethearchaeota archaeon]